MWAALGDAVAAYQGMQIAEFIIPDPKRRFSSAFYILNITFTFKLGSFLYGVLLLCLRIQAADFGCHANSFFSQLIRNGHRVSASC